MLKLWTYSTAVFVLQVSVGALVFRWTGDIALAAVAVTTALAFTAVATTFLVFTTALSAAGAAFAVAGAFVPVAFVPAATPTTIAFATVGALAAASAAARLAKEEGAQEPEWMIRVAALPLLIGTVLGGILLLTRRKQDASHV